MKHPFAVCMLGFHMKFINKDFENRIIRKNLELNSIYESVCLYVIICPSLFVFMNYITQLVGFCIM